MNPQAILHALGKLPAVVLVLDHELRLRYVNENARLAFGCNGHPLEGEYVRQAIPAIPEAWQEYIQQALAGVSIHRNAEAIRLPSGEQKWFRLDIQPWAQPDGQASGILMFAEDNTVSKQAELNLSALHERLGKLFSLVPDAICMFRLFPDGSAELPYQSQHFLSLLARMPDPTLDASRWFHAVHPQDAERIRISSAQANRTRKTWHDSFRIILDTSEQRWLEGYCIHVPDLDGSACWWGILRDITVQKTLEQNLQETREEYRALVENSPDAIVRVDRDCRYLFANKRFQEAVGLTFEQLLGKTAAEAGMAPDIAENCQRAMQTVFETGEPSISELSCPSHDGRGIWEVRNIPEFDEGGTVHSVLMIGLDITQRRQAESLARQQQDELTDRGSMITTLFESVSQAILAVDAEGKIALINRMAEELFGYSKDELVGEPHELLIPEQLREKHTALRQEFMTAPRSRSMGSGNNLHARRKDGSIFPVEVSLSVVQTARGPLAVSFVTDITARKKNEETLQQNAQELRKLSAALITAQEEAARKIALELHDDITQRLAFLSMEIGRVAAQPLVSDELNTHLRSFQTRILEISDSIRKISHEMHPSILDDLGLDAAIESMCADFQRLHGVHTRFISRGVPENLDRKAAMCLYRVSQESLRNASKHSNSKDLTLVLSREDNFLQLAVIDSGVGFDPANHKEGFGMLSMRERVRQLQGNIRIDSMPGEGTRVVVRVPWRTGGTESSAHSSGK